ncbi:UNVERIFIED_CONTAM: MLO-like protein 11 [Sesamum calycinum]|uniref:MLO-like protein n=1 Tax=Sesamum calycinum TaxID=2727403 RepID=A0AAW2Q4Q7_9LAMI
MSAAKSDEMSDSTDELRSLAMTPTWSVASVLTIFVVVSLLVERSIHRLSKWLNKTGRKPLQAAVEKMKEELMLLGFISLLLTATSSTISNICIPSRFTVGEGGRMRLTWTDIIHYATCFFRQFGHSVVRADYLTLRQGFIMNHNLTPKYDFHSYMVRSMEEEFNGLLVLVPGSGILLLLYAVQCERYLLEITRIHSHFLLEMVSMWLKPGSLSGETTPLPLDKVGSNLYFWISLIPITLVLLVGTKLQHVIATLALESAGISGNFARPKFKLRDELFWFKKPELLLSLIHFILFQIKLYLGLTIDRLRQLLLLPRFAGQFLCSYSTLPLYALVTQMGTNYKAALIPQRIRETIHGWGKAARRKRKMGGFADDSTVHTDTSTVISVEEYDDDMLDSPRFPPQADAETELQPPSVASNGHRTVPNETSSRFGTPLLRPSASISSSVSPTIVPETIQRSSTMPR